MELVHVQIGCCGLDGKPEHGAMPGAPVNGRGSLDINVYCKCSSLYTAYYTAMFIQVYLKITRVTQLTCGCAMSVHVCTVYMASSQCLWVGCAGNLAAYNLLCRSLHAAVSQSSCASLLS